MQDILLEIVANKRAEVEKSKKKIPQEQLEQQIALSQCHSLSSALKKSATGIIAEFKRKSPSKGWIHKDANPLDTVPYYEEAGASAISVLTDEKYFGGSLADIKTIGSKISIPILRKDFIVDNYQLYESKAAGADAVLLIASAIKRTDCQEFIQTAHSLKMEVLLEIHQEKELDYYTPECDVIGVNNRCLGSFVTDVKHSFELAKLLPKDAVKISESGIKDAETVIHLKAAGYKGFLIGETFMREAEPAKKLKEFIATIEQSSKSNK